MAKSKDPFDALRKSALSQSSLASALDTVNVEKTSPAEPVQPVAQPTPANSPDMTPAPEGREQKQKKDVNEEQVAFFIDKELKRKFGMLKYELGVQYKDLYNEAITDLLKKYHKI